jgi:hypothetical protein
MSLQVLLVRQEHFAKIAAKTLATLDVLQVPPPKMLGEIAWGAEGMYALCQRQSFVAKAKETYLWSFLLVHRDLGCF